MAVPACVSGSHCCQEMGAGGSFNEAGPREGLVWVSHALRRLLADDESGGSCLPHSSERSSWKITFSVILYF